jgi:hypothetical protein
MSETIDLLEEVQKLPKENKLLFTSYEFTQPFFEKHIFPIFKNKTYPLILLDYSSYIQNIKQIKSRNVETRYFLNAVKIKGSFHPKIVLSSGENSLKLILGSSNITYGGYANNAEINSIFEIEYEKNQYPGVLTSINEFLDGLIGITKSEPHKKQIQSLKNSIKIEQRNENDSIWFFHNFNENILDQTLNKIESEMKEAYIISPFFSQDKDFYNKIFNQIKCPITFIVQKKKNNLPIEILKAFKDKHLTFKTVTFNEQRYLHAKVILLKTKNHSYCLFGSANFTTPALLLTPREGGNVETCILRKEKDPTYFDYLIADEKLKIKSSTLEGVESINIPIQSYESYDFHIEQASIYGEELSITFDKQIKGEHTLIIHIDGLDQPITVRVNTNRIKIKLSEIQLEKIQESTIISLELKNETESSVSDMIWVHNPQFFPEDFSILNNIIEQDEARWIFSLFNKIAQLPSLNYVIPILNVMNDMGIFDIENKEEKQKKIIELNKKIYKIAGRKERLITIIELFIKRHEKRMNNALSLLDLKDTNVVVNSFNLINKLVLWSVINNYQDIHYLRMIKNNFEKLTSYFSEFGDQISKTFLDNQQFIAETLIQIYLVDKLQISSTIFKAETSNFHVKKAFEETFLNFLKMVKRTTGKNVEEYTINTTSAEYQLIMHTELSDYSIKDKLKKIFPTFG